MADLHVSLCVLDNLTRETVSKARAVVKSVKKSIQENNHMIVRPSGPLALYSFKRFLVIELTVDAEIVNLVKRLRQLLLDATGARDQYDFSAHLTLARMKEGEFDLLPYTIPRSLSPFVFQRDELEFSHRKMTKARLARLEELAKKLALIERAASSQIGQREINLGEGEANT